MHRPAADIRTLTHSTLGRTLVAALCAGALGAALALGGCASSTSRSMPDSALKSAQKEAAVPPTSSRTTVVLAVTPAVAGTGLGDALAAAFGAATPQYAAKVVTMPEGGAVAFAKRGEADVMLADGDATAKALVSQGFASGATPAMADHLVLVGPATDPAGTAKAGSLPKALARIADAGAGLSRPGEVPVRFLAGPDAAERALWVAAGRRPSGAWYLGASPTAAGHLADAAGQQAYAIASRALFLRSMSGDRRMAILVDGGSASATRYFVLKLAGASDPRAADQLTTWLKSQGRDVMISFGSEGGGAPAFVPVGR